MKKVNRFLSLLLVVAMLIGLVPANVLAAEEQAEPVVTAADEWVQVQAAGQKYQYTLDTDGVNSGSSKSDSNSYLIVSSDGTKALSATPTTVVDVTDTDGTILLDSRDNEYWVYSETSGSWYNRQTLYYIRKGSNNSSYLWHANNVLSNNNSKNSHDWVFSHQGSGLYQVNGEDDNGSWYLQYSALEKDFRVESAADTVRMYRYNGTTNVSALYASAAGTFSYELAMDVYTQAEIEEMIKEGITGAVSSSADGSDATELEDSALTWTWADTVNPAAAGTYTMDVSYMGVVLDTVSVVITEKEIAGYTVASEGWVEQYSSGSTKVTDEAGNVLYVTINYADGTTAQVPVTVDMLTTTERAGVNTKIAGDVTGLKVYCGTALAKENFTLHITEKWVNNYPEYPNEGAVKVDKTATGIDFQSSGVAQVEVSASGVPMKKGADVIVMLDTSSSMRNWCVNCHRNTGGNCGSSCWDPRSDVLEQSLKNLITQFKQDGADGEPLDIRVAIADFNGFYGENQGTSGTAYDRDAADMMSDDIFYNAASSAQVYTGDGTLGAGAFIDAADLADIYNFNYVSGTNYDYAMDAIYQLGTAIKAQNEVNGEERDLFVIFMSDGAAMQWNYYHSQGNSSLWNNWITGEWSAADLTRTNLNCVTHAYYYDEADHDSDGMVNEHRMANAIKGSADETFEVIRKTSGLGTATGERNMYMVPGLDATMFSISFDAQDDGNVTQESMNESIASLASDQVSRTQYYYEVTSAQELGRAFIAIGTEIAYAAYNAYLEDQMGAAFNLQMAAHSYASEGSSAVDSTITPKIEVLTYDIYTRSEWVTDGSVAEDEAKIGTREASGTVVETVTFNEGGTMAYSSLIGDGNTNILTDGVIYASNFLYNTTAAEVAVTVDGKSITLAPESFYWIIGTITEAEVALRYYVYLEGSMEGLRDAGSYPTNNYATLYYDNYLDNPCEKPTVSPVMAWESANVSYAFYLVDEDGNIIVNQTTGATGSFANKIAVTSPVVYSTINLNNLDVVNGITVSSSGVLPEGYALYDASSTYEIKINSNSTGTWEITKSADKVNSTYVTQYLIGNGSAYSNELTPPATSNDYTHTVVWFAVLWKPQALPDAVVIDYGLPVDISVMANDMFGENGKLAGISKYSADAHDTLIDAAAGNGSAIADGFVTADCAGDYGKASANRTTGIVRYQLDGMTMDKSEKFTYAVDYAGSVNAGYYYDTVTVIPATTIYYEDSFVNFSTELLTNGTVETSWTTVGTTVDAVQAEDRPGEYSLPEIDANNVYGYDAAYEDMKTYSLGSAHKVTVTEKQNRAKAGFTFTGTGFDVISMTSNTTGTISVTVKQGDTVVKDVLVDTYYGYTWSEELGWTVNSDTDNSLYQVPVMKIEDLPYGTYDVVITAAYNDLFHHGQDGKDKADTANSYDFYLDAIRIYDPANDGAADQTVADAYVADNEGWPEYHELRNLIIAAADFNSNVESSANGIVYIDGKDHASIEDYTSYGPNNELYLTSGNAVAFNLTTTDSVADVQLAVKSADGRQVILDCFNAEADGTVSNRVTELLDTTTDLYYSINAQAVSGKVIVIKNTGEGIMSITNIKITYKSAPASVVSFSIAPQAANYAAAAVGKATEETVNPFEDVTKDDYFFKSVLWALLNKITSGKTEEFFAPADQCTRAEVVTFLWRAAGAKKAENREHTFTDVTEDFYYEAMLWAVENGITTGMTETTFAPNQVCTRAEVVTFLWRTAGSERPVNKEHIFTDVTKDFYYEAMLWAVENGITTGMTETTFAPENQCIRADVVTLLYRANK